MNLKLINLHPSLRPPPSKWRKVIRQLTALLNQELHLRHLNVVWVDDLKIAKANEQYLKHCGGTDILTFDYGNGFAEILISLDTALCQAQKYKQTFEAELTLYLAHGLLHLTGIKDKTSGEQRRMRKEEQRLIRHLRL